MHVSILDARPKELLLSAEKPSHVCRRPCPAVGEWAYVLIPTLPGDRGYHEENGFGSAFFCIQHQAMVNGRGLQTTPCVEQ